MFMNDVSKKEEIRNIAIQDLRGFGVKYRQKKAKHNIQETKTRKAFKNALHLLPMETVTMPTGQQLIVPKLVHELSSFIIAKVDTEGIFRKGGSKARQNEIKLSLDAGCYLGDNHHEIDIASVLKTFFRELPEPLFPYSYHELFLRCMLLKESQLEAVLLSCLLLPTEHLNTLTYFMQFLHRVAEYSSFNKMDAYNLAIVMGPTLLPGDEKLAPSATQRLTKTCELFKLLIENACSIGVLPEHIIERIAMSSSVSSLNEDSLNAKKKKKRRSGSLTRMFNGLKKIVTSKISDDTNVQAVVTPDLLLTPCMTRSAKKRKLESGFSSKKRKDFLHNLPQGSALCTPYTPCRTPVSVDPNPKKKTSPASNQKIPAPASKTEITKEKWYSRTKSKKRDDETSSITSQISLGAKNALERRWSAVSQATSFKRNKKRNSCTGSLAQNQKPNESNTNGIIPEVVVTQASSDVDYVRIPKTEYEAIKSRVSAIERRISLELDNAESTDPIDKVQNAYEQTLVQAEALSPTTDHLARRLSKELKIRRSSEQRIIRSPSARKIGSLRRKSRELERQKVTRNQSWHVATVDTARGNLKRGRPNTVLTGLKTPVKGEGFAKPPPPVGMSAKKAGIKSSSFNSPAAPSPLQKARSVSNSVIANGSKDKWTSAEGFFTELKTPGHGLSLENCRASIAKIRSQNAGMVLAKTKLFDGLLDSDSGQSSSDMGKIIPRVKSGNKIGNVRNADRQSSRIRALKAEERRLGKKSLSPRKRTIPRNRLQITKQPPDVGTPEKENVANCQKKPGDFGNSFDVPDLIKSPVCCNSPRNVPYIKKTLNVKSPKRLLRTPIKIDYKHTPVRAISTPTSGY